MQTTKGGINVLMLKYQEGQSQGDGHWYGSASDTKGSGTSHPSGCRPQCVGMSPFMTCPSSKLSVLQQQCPKQGEVGRMNKERKVSCHKHFSFKRGKVLQKFPANFLLHHTGQNQTT